MTRRMASLILCGGVAVLAAACATKSFVQKQVTAAESRLTQEMTAKETTLTERVELHETQLRQTADRAGESRQAIDAADQRLNRLDVRMADVRGLASVAKTRADLATEATNDAEARLSHRLATRNRNRLLDTKSVYFASGQIEIRSQDVNQLDDVAKALMADPNAILELQGFADSQGSDRYNRELARERVEAVMRYLVQRHGIELRQMQALSMGKVAVGAGEKTSPEALASARRVDIRLLAPWSSWEDAQAQLDQVAPEQTAIYALPVQSEPTQPPQADRVRAPARERLPAFLRTITPEDLGGEVSRQ